MNYFTSCIIYFPIGQVNNSEYALIGREIDWEIDYLIDILIDWLIVC